MGLCVFGRENFGVETFGLEVGCIGMNGYGGYEEVRVGVRLGGG